MYRRVIITGANGAGKSHLARDLAAMRGAPIISFDALKLTTGWRTRPRRDSEADLTKALGADCWIVEGGPSLLPLALPSADAVIWLDPPLSLRAWRLAIRPWRHLGETRPELPPENPDHVITQYRFAWRSLRRSAAFTRSISQALETAPHAVVWRCKTQQDIARAKAAWAMHQP